MYSLIFIIFIYLIYIYITAGLVHSAIIDYLIYFINSGSISLFVSVYVLYVLLHVIILMFVFPFLNFDHKY